MSAAQASLWVGGLAALQDSWYVKIPRFDELYFWYVVKVTNEFPGCCLYVFNLSAAYRIRRSTYAHAVLGNVIWITVFRCRAIVFADDRSVLSEEGSWFCGEDSEQCTSDSWSDIPSAQLLEQISQEVSASKGSTKAEVQLRCVSLLIELLCLFFTVRQCRGF